MAYAYQAQLQVFCAISFLGGDLPRGVYGGGLSGGRSLRLSKAPEPRTLQVGTTVVHSAAFARS